MTTEQLRELDAWIHSHIFETDGPRVGLLKRGLWWRPDAKGYTSKQSEAWRLTPQQALKYTTSSGESDPVTVGQFDIPKYTTSAADAFDVLEKCLRANGEDIIITTSDVGHPVVGSGFTVSINYGWETTEAYGETLPIAICLFARELFKEEEK